MRILYAVQGTGNGHVSRAMDIVPILQKKGTVDVLVSGIQADLTLPFEVKYKFRGLSFIFGKKGGVDLVATYKKSHLRKLLSEVKALPVEEYDLVISDFEPVSSWACYLKGKQSIALSHQAAVINKKSPQAKHIDPLGRTILKRYAPSSASYGFHFKSYDEHIYTPVIREQIRNAIVTNEGHYTVYLPAYNDKRIVKILSQVKDVQWQVFSKHFAHSFSAENVDVYPISNDAFVKSMTSAEGVLCGAGFETPAECLFLRKKLLVIPMRKQFEQHCNAAALAEMGVPVIKSLKQKHLHRIEEWTGSSSTIQVNYPNITESIIDYILETHAPVGAAIQNLIKMRNDEFTTTELKNLTFNKIISKMKN